MIDLTKIDKPFGELDDATKGALLLAYHEGKVIEYRTLPGVSFSWCRIPNLAWRDAVFYRVKPESVRETIMHDMQISTHGPSIAPCVSTCGQDGPLWTNGTLTIETVDGKPVSATWVAK